MVSTCLVCKWKGDGKPKRSFHIFPRNYELQQKWLEIIGKSSNFTITKSSVLCCIHFEQDCFRVMDGLIGQRKILIEGSLPTLYLTKENSMQSNLLNDPTSQVVNVKDELDDGDMEDPYNALDIEDKIVKFPMETCLTELESKKDKIQRLKLESMGPILQEIYQKMESLKAKYTAASKQKRGALELQASQKGKSKFETLEQHRIKLEYNKLRRKLGMMQETEEQRQQRLETYKQRRYKYINKNKNVQSVQKNMTELKLRQRAVLRQQSRMRKNEETAEEREQRLEKRRNYSRKRDEILRSYLEGQSNRVEPLEITNGPQNNLEIKEELHALKTEEIEIEENHLTENDLKLSNVYNSGAELNSESSNISSPVYYILVSNTPEVNQVIPLSDIFIKYGRSVASELQQFSPANALAAEAKIREVLLEFTVKESIEKKNSNS